MTLGTVVLSVLAFAAAMLGIRVHRVAKIRAALQGLAPRVGGDVHAQGWLPSPRLHWQEHGVSAELTFAGEILPMLPVLRFGWLPGGRFGLRPTQSQAIWERVQGVEDIPLDDPTFNDRFLIRGGPMAWVREVLDEPARARIMELYAMSRVVWHRRGNRSKFTYHLTVDADSTGLTIALGRVLELPSEEEALARMLDQGVALFRALHARQSPDFALQQAVEWATQGRCPGCGTRPEGTLWHCPACRTTHHATCRNRLGKCALPTCGGC